MTLEDESPSIETSSLRTDAIRLDQLLKLLGWVGTGGEAKHRIQAGEVSVNGQVETRRGRRLLAGDLVAMAARSHRLEIHTPE